MKSINIEFNNLVRNIHNAKYQCAIYTDERLERIKNIFYKKIIKNSYNLHSLIININKFFNINISLKNIKNHITKIDKGYKLTFDIDSYDKRFIIQYPLNKHDTIKILYNMRYKGFMLNDGYLLFEYNNNKYTKKIIEQLKQCLYLSNIKVEHANLLKKYENLSKEIKDIENLIKQIEGN